MTRSAILPLLASGLLLVAAACKSEDTPPPAAPETTAGTPATTIETSTSPTTYTVGDTFGALRAIHTAEIEHGNLAMQKATNKEVRDFAEKVIDDHRARMQKEARTMSALGVSPRDNSVSMQIKSAAAEQTTKLSALSGPDFDREYVDQQINYYRMVLDTFDRDLLPNVRDPQIKSQVEEARQRANDHLKAAQDLRLKLANQR